MKKVLVLLLALVMIVSLCACGGDSVTGTLTSTEWKAVLAYGGGPDTLSVEKDGTGSLSYSKDGYSEPITWSAQDNEISIKWETTKARGGNILRTYVFNLVEVNDSYRLVVSDAEEASRKHWTFVPKDKYESETEAIKAERTKEAKEINWSAAWSIYYDNEAKANETYVGKLWKRSGMVQEINAGYCRIGIPGVVGTKVYMSDEDLTSIDPGDVITFVGVLGYFGDFGGMFYNAFIVQE